jgi:hypothetical protein
VNIDKDNFCPFKGGMNQLWRNQLLGLALENAGIYAHVYFSVFKHPGNTALNKTIGHYKTLINDSPKLFDFDSKEVVDAVRSLHDHELKKWVDGYSDLYDIT